MTLIPSDEAKEFMEFQKTYDKNEANIIDQDDAWYYADKKFVTNSHLKQILSGGPQTLKAYYEKGQEDKASFAFGRAAHCLLLEADSFNSRFYSVDDTEICDEIGGKRPTATKVYKEWLENIKTENAHRQLLSLDDMMHINNMVDKAMSYPQVREMVEAALYRERIYSSELEGVNCKIKVDAINPSNFILDYKTSKDPATLYNFGNSIKKYSYDRQGAFYKDVAKTDSFWFLAQEKTYPYTVCLAEMSPQTYEDGQVKYKRGLSMYKEHFIHNPKGIDDYLEIGSV